MLFRQLFDTETSTYTYLIADEVSREAVIIDPVRAHVDQYVTLLSELGLSLIFALDTHVHADHITALGELRDRTACRSLMGEQAQAPCVSGRFHDGETIEVGALQLKAIYTPGHTDDSYSFLLVDGDKKMVFTGDALLIRSCGRTDFQNGNAATQYHTLFDRLMLLPEDTLVYPGHDYNGMLVSSIGEEKRFNPRLQVQSQAEFEAMMASLNLAPPKWIHIAVPANRSCGKTPKAH